MFKQISILVVILSFMALPSLAEEGNTDNSTSVPHLNGENKTMELDGSAMNILIPPQDKTPEKQATPSQEKAKAKTPDEESKEKQSEKKDSKKTKQVMYVLSWKSLQEKKTEIPRMKPINEFLPPSLNSGGGVRIIPPQNPGQKSPMGNGKKGGKAEGGDNGVPGGISNKLMIYVCKKGCTPPPNTVPYKGPIPEEATIIDYNCRGKTDSEKYKVRKK